MGIETETSRSPSTQAGTCLSPENCRVIFSRSLSFSLVYLSELFVGLKGGSLTACGKQSASLSWPACEAGLQAPRTWPRRVMLLSCTASNCCHTMGLSYCSFQAANTLFPALSCTLATVPRHLLPHSHCTATTVAFSKPLIPPSPTAQIFLASLSAFSRARLESSAASGPPLAYRARAADGGGPHPELGEPWIEQLPLLPAGREHRL